MTGKCWCCGDQLKYDEYEAGHIIAVANGGETVLDNLRPVCKICNNNCRTKNMLDYKNEIIRIRGRPSA